MVQPNFLLIGAAKAGTTALHSALSRHPEIFMSKTKEPAFFVAKCAQMRIPTLRDQILIEEDSAYKALFDGAKTAKVVGESSTYYLDYASDELVSLIKETLRNVKILAVLRHPVDQAYSRFTMWQTQGRSSEFEFRDRFMHDLKRFDDLDYTKEQQDLVVRSYYKRLSLFYNRFCHKNLKVMLYDDFDSDAQAFLEELHRFLGVEVRKEPRVRSRINSARLHQYSAASFIMNRPNPVRWLARRLLPDDVRLTYRDTLLRKLSKPAPSLDPALRAELTELVHDEISNLANLIGRNLSHWKGEQSIAGKHSGKPPRL